MTQIDIISGFLGAGKTTLIKKLLDELFVTKSFLVFITSPLNQAIYYRNKEMRIQDHQITESIQSKIQRCK